MKISFLFSFLFGSQILSFDGVVDPVFMFRNMLISE